MKYTQLYNQLWLRKKYIEEQKSTIEIAKIIGCSLRAVGYALKKFDIEARSLNEARNLQSPRPLIYSELNDREWLHTKYIIEKLSTEEIANLIGAKTGNTIRQALLRFEISVRNRSDGQTVNRESDYFVLDLPTIEGSLLGDGSLDIWNRESDISFPYFHKKNIHYDHVLFVANNIFARNPEFRISYYERIKDGKKQSHFWLSSLTHKELLPFYRKWYPKENEYKKVIPEDIEISQQLLLHMFLDDGTSFQRRKESNTKQVQIKLCSECFSRDNQEMFCDKVNAKFRLGLKTTPYNAGLGWRIMVPQSKANLFYEVIGESPVQSLAYKWK